MSADGTAFVWAPLEGTVVFSQDKGATWARAEGLRDAEVSPDWAPVPFRPAADRVNAKKFYVLDAKGGQAFTSVDGGAHFTASPTGLPALADYQFGSASAGPRPESKATASSSATHASTAASTWEPAAAGEATRDFSRSNLRLAPGRYEAKVAPRHVARYARNRR